MPQSVCVDVCVWPVGKALKPEHVEANIEYYFYFLAPIFRFLSFCVTLKLTRRNMISFMAARGCDRRSSHFYTFPVLLFSAAQWKVSVFKCGFSSGEAFEMKLHKDTHTPECIDILQLINHVQYNLFKGCFYPLVAAVKSEQMIHSGVNDTLLSLQAISSLASVWMYCSHILRFPDRCLRRILTGILEQKLLSGGMYDKIAIFIGISVAEI